MGGTMKKELLKANCEEMKGPYAAVNHHLTVSRRTEAFYKKEPRGEGNTMRQQTTPDNSFIPPTHYIFLPSL